MDCIMYLGTESRSRRGIARSNCGRDLRTKTRIVAGERSRFGFVFLLLLHDFIIRL